MNKPNPMNKFILLFTPVFLSFSSLLSQNVINKVEVPRAHINKIHKYSLKGYLMFNDNSYEKAPGGLPHELIQDRVTIEKIENDSVFVKIEWNTDINYDQPLNQWKIWTGLVLAKEIYLLEDDSIYYNSYNYLGKTDYVNFQYVSLAGYAQLKVTKPEEKSFKIVKRINRYAFPIHYLKKRDKIIVKLFNTDSNMGGFTSSTYTWEIKD